MKTLPIQISDIPLWRIDNLLVYGDEAEDDEGRSWTVSTENGWIGSTKPRTQRVDRPFWHGSYRGAAYKDVRTITLAGSVWCPDRPTREHTEVELSALCSDPGRLYTLRRTTNTFDQVAAVELDDMPLITMATTYRLDWSFQFTAPDPRKHDFDWQEPISTLPIPGIGGFDPDAGFDTSGFDFGASTTEVVGKVANYGTAPAYPVFILNGPLTYPTVVDLTSGFKVTYSDVLGPSDVLYINCDAFAQRGLPGHSVLLNKTMNVRSSVTLASNWPYVEPYGVHSFELLASPGGAGSQLMTCLRSAYH